MNVYCIMGRIHPGEVYPHLIKMFTDYPKAVKYFHSIENEREWDYLKIETWVIDSKTGVGDVLGY